MDHESTRTLADVLGASGHPVSHVRVAKILHSLHYSLQGNAKTTEGAQHPDRDAQFRYIKPEPAIGKAVPYGVAP